MGWELTTYGLNKNKHETQNIIKSTTLIWTMHHVMWEEGICCTLTFSVLFKQQPRANTPAVKKKKPNAKDKQRASYDLMKGMIWKYLRRLNDVRCCNLIWKKHCNSGLLFSYLFCCHPSSSHCCIPCHQHPFISPNMLKQKQNKSCSDLVFEYRCQFSGVFHSLL